MHWYQPSQRIMLITGINDICWCWLGKCEVDTRKPIWWSNTLGIENIQIWRFIIHSQNVNSLKGNKTNNVRYIKTKQSAMISRVIVAYISAKGKTPNILAYREIINVVDWKVGNLHKAEFVRAQLIHSPITQLHVLVLNYLKLLPQLMINWPKSLEISVNLLRFLSTKT